MNRNFLIFINPISGTSGKQKLEQALRVTMEKHYFTYSIKHTQKDDSYDKEKTLAFQMGITDVIICGGDGTINRIAAYFTNTNIRIGIIPMGSGNGLAYAMGIPANIQKAIEIIIHGQVKPIDAFLVNNQFACMLAGVGLDAQIAHDFSRQKRRGLLTYLRISAIAFFRCGSFPLTLHVNSQKIESKFRFVSIANSNQFGNRVTIAPKASLSDGLLDIVAVKHNNRLATVMSVLRQILFGRLQTNAIKKNKSILYFQTSVLNIDNPSKAPLHIDGEPIITAERMEIRVLPSALQVIQPL